MLDMETREPAQAFKVRFSDPRTRAALHAVANQLGLSMNEVADRAIEHELMLSSAFVASDLEATAANLRALSAERYEALLARSDAAFTEEMGRPEVIAAQQLPAGASGSLSAEALDSFRTAFADYRPSAGE